MSLAPPAPSVEPDHRDRYLALSADFTELQSLTLNYYTDVSARFQRINEKLDAFRSAHIETRANSTMGS